MCCIDYPEHGLFICSSNSSCFINVVFDKFHGMYLFMQFTFSKKYMHTMIKRIIMLKSNHSILHGIMLKFYNDYIRDLNVEDKYSCEEKKVMGINKYADIYICISDSYHATFKYGISTARLQDKFPLLYYVR